MESDLFQVLLRIPAVCLKPLHWLSGIDGVYVEPRTPDGRSPDPSMLVIWLPGISFEEALHRQKTTDKALPIARFGWKYGIRIFAKDSDQMQVKLGAEEIPQQVQIQRIYEMRPFPHGTQKRIIQQFLQQMQWPAKVIQPGRSDAAGMVWKVGSEQAPPMSVVSTSRGDVTITLQKQIAAGPPLQQIFGSSKTQAHIRQQLKERSKMSKASTSADKENVPPYASASKGVDPWQHQNCDPWRRYGGPHAATEDTPMQATPKLDSIEERLRGEITTVVQQATDSRMSHLQELKHQQVKFESWCHEAGQANVQLQSQLHQLAATVSEHTSELTDMGKEIKSGFSNIEALLAEAFEFPEHAVQSEPFSDEFLSSEQAEEARERPSLPNFQRKLSWTLEFLQYMNAAATANQFGDPDAEVAVEAADDYDHVMVLTNYPGQRNWRFYRPDPQRTLRPSFLDVQATPDLALAEIQRRVLLHWPDLLGATAWALVEVSPTVSYATHLPDDMEAFVLRADVDCGPTERVVLLESQTWRIANDWYSSHLYALVISQSQDPMILPALIDWHDHCSRVLCPVWANGRTIRPTERLQEGDGSYVIIFFTSEVYLISTVTAHLTDFPGQFRISLDLTETTELPIEFLRRVYVHMGPSTGIPFDTVGFHVINFQLAFTDWYRWLYCYSGMRNIRRHMVALFHPSQPPGDPTTFMRLAVPQPFDVPRFYADLIDYDFVTQDDWELVFMGHMIGELLLPQDVQYFGIAHYRDREHPLHLNLVLFEIQVAYRHGFSQSVPTYVTLMVKETSSWFALLHMTGNLEQCHEHWECVIQVDGTFVLPHQEDVFVYDGSIVRIWMGDYHMELNDTIAEEMNQQAVNEPPVTLRQFLTSSPSASTTQSAPFAPISGTLQSLASLLLWMLGPSLGRRFPRSIKLRIRQRRIGRRPDGLRLRRCLPGSCRRLSRSSLSRYCKLNTLLFLCLAQHLHMGAVAIRSHTWEPTRYGEARHPGPSCFIGTTNPGGIKGKEMIYGQLPFGIWGISETQLAQPGLRAVKSAFARASREYGKDLFVLPGAMVPLRPRSQTAGTWAGVMTIADMPLRQIYIHWPHAEYLDGRVQLFEGHFGGLRLTGATVYGWPSGPTYPQAAQHTNDMLNTLVKELAISRNGPRFLLGDFNHAEHKLPAIELLRSQGWREIQELGFSQNSWTPIPTCKGATTIDMVFVSPELLPYYKKTASWPWFADHTIVGGEFDLPVKSMIQKAWPLPAKIPWDQVQWQAWSQQKVDCAHLDALSLDEAFSEFCRQYEATFTGQMDTPDGLLPTTCTGRGQRLEPAERPGALPLLRPSRAGELTQASDLLGRTPQKWFLQARRIQSMLHAVLAASPAATAQQYRAELWGAILRGRGFKSGFREWPSTPILFTIIGNLNLGIIDIDLNC
eukprot:s3975_g3.t2